MRSAHVCCAAPMCPLHTAARRAAAGKAIHTCILMQRTQPGQIACGLARWRSSLHFKASSNAADAHKHGQLSASHCTTILHYSYTSVLYGSRLPPPTTPGDGRGGQLCSKPAMTATSRDGPGGGRGGRTGGFGGRGGGRGGHFGGRGRGRGGQFGGRGGGAGRPNGPHGGAVRKPATGAADDKKVGGKRRSLKDQIRGVERLLAKVRQVLGIGFRGWWWWGGGHARERGAAGALALAHA